MAKNKVLVVQAVVSLTLAVVGVGIDVDAIPLPRAGMVVDDAVIVHILKTVQVLIIVEHIEPHKVVVKIDRIGEAVAERIRSDRISVSIKVIHHAVDDLRRSEAGKQRRAEN